MFRKQCPQQNVWENPRFTYLPKKNIRFLASKMLLSLVVVEGWRERATWLVTPLQQTYGQRSDFFPSE